MKSLYRMASLPGKWLFIALMAFTMQVHAAANQDSAALVTLKVSNAPIEDVFLRIEAQTGFSFTYSTQLIDKKEKVSVDFKREQLGDVLRELLGKRNLRWVIRGAGIVILQDSKPATQIERFSATDSIPKIDVRGVVTDKSGNPIPGATVSLKGQSRGQSTDGEGRFFFMNMPVNGVIQVSSIGFESAQMKLQGQRDVHIKLDTLIREIKGVEVVSTGYQDIPKERATGSFVKIDNSTFNRTVSTNVLDRLINVTNSLRTERNSNSTNISIRGISTINADMKPLIVVDGFPYQEGDYRSIKIDIRNLNPNDIESVTVLRDAAAASIWGARAGNGVVVITTKKGRFNQKPSIQLSYSINFTERPNLKELNIISSKDAVEYEKGLFASGFYNSYNGPFSSTYSFPRVSPVIEILLALKKNSITVNEANNKLDMLSSHDVRDDIMRYLMQVSVNQQANVNISGGGDKSNYYASFGYDKNKLNQIGNDNSRITFRLENTFRLLKFLEFGTYIAYTQSQDRNNGIDYTNYIANGGIQTAPYVMLADKNGNALHAGRTGQMRTAYIDTVKGSNLLDWHYYPLNEIKYNDNVSRLNNVRLGGNVRFIIRKGIDVEIKGQYENGIVNNRNYYSLDNYLTRDLVNKYSYIDGNGKAQYPIPLGGILDYSNISQVSWNIRSQLNINQAWMNHSISGVVGTEIRELEVEENRGRYYGYNETSLSFVPNLDYNTLFRLRPAGTGRIPNPFSLGGSLNRFRSYFSNIGYTFMSKYMLSASGRVDASNFLGAKANQKAVPLWSIGGGWNISNEDFFTSHRNTTIKIRLTYGYNGNMNNTITALPVIQYSPPSHIYVNQEYASLVSPPNPGLSWEKVRMLNVGVDFGFFTGRLNGSIEYYSKKGENLIGNIETEYTTGVTKYMGNYANMQGRGIDFILNALLIDRNLKWQSSALFSYNTDKITKYFQDTFALKSAISNLGGRLPVLDMPLYKIYSYRWAGLDPNSGDPLGFVNNEKKRFNEVISANKASDLVYHGTASPKFFGSFINTISYKGIAISCNATFKFGYYFRRSSINYTQLRSNWGGHSDYAARWRNKGDESITNVPSMPTTIDNRYNFYGNSEILVERGDHIRLQDIRLSYDLMGHLVRMPFSAAQFFIYINNVGTIWMANKSGLDPEFFNSIPPPKSLALGVNMSF